MADTNKLNILIEAGSDFAMSFVITDNNDNIVDLTGALIEARLRQFEESNDYFPFTVTHSGSTGRVKISMPHEMTSEIPYTNGVYDVKITFENGIKKKPFYGEAFINEEVTRPYDGTILNVLAMQSIDKLPSIGQLNRLYYIYDNNEFYRWNGTNYVTAADPNSIIAVTKISSSGLIDKYRIHFSNGNYSEFQVKNGSDGSSIAHIEKTLTDGIVDTYTITLTNGQEYSFQVTNGIVGVGISSIEKTGTSGNIDTYTITLTNNNTYQFQVTNGVDASSIASIEKTGTEGRVDTYTITLTNGKKETFTVTNGEKGDRGLDGSGTFFYDEDTELINMFGEIPYTEVSNESGGYTAIIGI